MSKRRYRPPYLQLSSAAKVELRSLLCEEAIGELEEVVEACMPFKIVRIGVPREQLDQLKASVDSLVEKLEHLPASAQAWDERNRTFSLDVRDTSWPEKLRKASKMMEFSTSEASSARPSRPGARGIPVERDGKLHWIEMPLSELRRFSEDLAWLLDALRSRGGRPWEAERDDQALAVAQVLQRHGIRPTKYRDGQFVKVLRIVLHEAGYQVPNDLRPIAVSAVDRLRAS